MNRARYKMMQDFLHVVLMGLVVGVLFSMAVTGVVFLVSGQQPGNADRPVQTQPGSRTEAKPGAGVLKPTPKLLSQPAGTEGRAIRI